MSETLHPASVRLLEEIDRLLVREGFRSERAFLLASNLNPVFLHKVRRGLIKPNPAHLKELQQRFGLNPAYILSGEGEPYGAPVDAPPGLPPVVWVPFVPLAARAGQGMSYDDDIFENPTERVPVYAFDPVPKDAIIIDVFGDSMEPKLSHGTHVLCRPIPPDQWKYQQSGVYAVRYGDGQIHTVIKRIKGNDLLRLGELQLHSDNPNAGGMVIPAAELKALYKVERIVNGRVD